MAVSFHFYVTEVESSASRGRTTDDEEGPSTKRVELGDASAMQPSKPPRFVLLLDEVSAARELTG